MDAELDIPWMKIASNDIINKLVQGLLPCKIYFMALAAFYDKLPWILKWAVIFLTLV